MYIIIEYSSNCYYHMVKFTNLVIPTTQLPSNQQYIYAYCTYIYIYTYIYVSISNEKKSKVKRTTSFESEL